LKINLKNITDEEVFEYLKSTNKQVSLEAFNELYSRYSTKIYTYCKKVLNNNAVAEDVFQETFTRLYESAKNGKVMTNFSGYVIKIARNLCLNEKPRVMQERIDVEDLQLPSFDSSYDKKQLLDVVDIAVQSLPEPYRDVIIMKEYMNMSYNEIGESLNISLSIVRIRIYRAKAKLRELLQPYLADLNKNIK
jgi:RNA polymerase sigma-70 factor (ECF subfamily)